MKTRANARRSRTWIKPDALSEILDGFLILTQPVVYDTARVDKVGIFRFECESPLGEFERFLMFALLFRQYPGEIIHGDYVVGPKLKKPPVECGRVRKAAGRLQQQHREQVHRFDAIGILPEYQLKNGLGRRVRSAIRSRQQIVRNGNKGTMILCVRFVPVSDPLGQLAPELIVFE